MHFSEGALMIVKSRSALDLADNFYTALTEKYHALMLINRITHSNIVLKRPPQ